MARVLAYLLTALLFTCQNSFATEPKWSYRVLRSAHFEIIYNRDQKNLAKRYLVAAEQAYEILMPIFKEGPSKTIIYIRDDTDSSNGLATFLPYPIIEVLPVQPTALDSLDDFGDWAFELVLHEYTHILNMYPAHGIYVPLKWIFGNVVRPNAILPKWYLEGLAIDFESRFSSHGRMRAADTQAAGRALVLSQRLRSENIERINESEIPTWPYGGRPYLFGGWWWKSTLKEHGLDAVYTWNQNFSRRLPFLINNPMSELTQKNASGLLTEALEDVESAANTELDILNKSAPPKSSEVAPEAGEQSIFALSPEGKTLLYWNAQPRSGAEVKIKTRTVQGQAFSEIEGRKIFKTSGSVSARFINENQILFDQIDLEYPRGNYRDLYIYEIDSKKTRRVTKQGRVQQAFPSKNGELAVAIQNEGGRTHLVQVNLQSGAITQLLPGSLFDRYSTPVYTPDGGILFVFRNRQGEERIFTFDASTKKAQAWKSDFKTAQHLRPATEKGWLVTDAKTGVRNAYLMDYSGANPRPVTNTRTSVEGAVYDPQRDELIYTELSADGRRLQAIKLGTQAPPQIAASHYDAPPKPATTSVKFAEESYQPIAYLWPRYWIPFIYPVEDGVLIQGSTGNQDPAGRNHYSLLGSYDSVTKKDSFGVSYVNSSLPTDIGLGYAKAQTYLGASNVTIQRQVANLQFSNYWPFNNRNTRWSLGGEYLETKRNTTTKLMGPEAVFTYSRLQGPKVDWWGFHLKASHTQYLKQDDYIDYGRSYLHVANVFHVGRSRQLLVQGRGMVAPDLPFNRILDLGDRNVGANYLVNLANSEFLLRGYPSGNFVGRKILNANLEFTFPLGDLTRGFGTFPLFLHNLQGAVFTDFMAVDGAGYKPGADPRGYYTRHLNQWFMGTGAELRLGTTAAYQLPLSFTLGAYYGVQEAFGGGFTPFIGIGLGDLSGLENKTP